MKKSDPRARSQRFSALAAVVALAALTALLAESSNQPEGAVIYSEVRAYLAATSDYRIPKPGEAPRAEGKLLAAAAEIREDLAPNRYQVRRQARLEVLEAIRSAYADQLLADDHIVGVGISVPSSDRKLASADWQLLILLAPGASDRDAAFALRTAGVTELLADFKVRYERIQAPVLTKDERPGDTRVWPGVQVGETCQGVNTMGWLVQSNQEDEVYVAGNATEKQSIGFMTVLHGTAPGFTHLWQNFQTIPREMQWSKFGFGCSGFSKAGRVIRAGPHDGLDSVSEITQDIDFVSLYAERACKQAGTDNTSEGIPKCDGFDDAVDGYEPLAVPVTSDEIDGLSGQEAQICGAETEEVRKGTLDGIHLDLALPVRDWDGNLIDPPETVHLRNTYAILNEIDDPEFSQQGDSGGPVWVLDDNALDGQGAWRPLGVQSAKATNVDETHVFSFITPLPDNLKDFDVSLIFNNPRDPESEFCTTCNCDCRAESFGVGPREGRLFLDTALATSPSAVSQLTSLAIRHEQELSSLLEARGVEVYKTLFEEDLAPYLRAAFNPPASRPKLSSREVASTLQILSFIHDSVRSKELQEEASKWYRFFAVYGQGRDFQELVRLYFLSSASSLEAKIAAR